MNKGEPLSNKPIINIETNKGHRTIKPNNENRKSKTLIIFLEPLFLYLLQHLKEGSNLPDNIFKRTKIIALIFFI